MSFSSTPLQKHFSCTLTILKNLHPVHLSTVIMRAQVLEAHNSPYVLRERAKPGSPTGHDLLIQVQAASYCHTDAVLAEGGFPQHPLPRVGCHEFAGTIIAMGSEVRPELGLKEGLVVGVPGRSYHSCGTCYECRNNDGDPETYGVWCTRGGNLGMNRDGGFQDYCIVDSRQVAPIPSQMSAVDAAPMMCAGLTVWNALGRAGVKLERGGGEGMTVAISGAGGGLGHIGVQFAVKLGCDVLAIDASDAALDILQEVTQSLGSQSSKVTVVDARTDKARTVRERTFGQSEPGLEGEKGADAVLILPESQRALDYGMELLKNHGTCVIVSFPKDGFHFEPRDLIFRHITLIGVLVGKNRQLRAMVNFAAEQGVRARIRTYALEELNDLVADYHKGVVGGKLVVDMLK
ncbi:alcohol dehydrogenase [Trichoderma velutinum]